MYNPPCFAQEQNLPAHEELQSILDPEGWAYWDRLLPVLREYRKGDCSIQMRYIVAQPPRYPKTCEACLHLTRRDTNSHLENCPCAWTVGLL